ncbi:NAD(P)H-binding protein [Dactylosporangium siamense]|uniref:NmrA family transcriptional regulator n=2 Tax=Dactylosporangium siamense TaxID=685454 RepID=A0A919UBG8_9ACTN|nr:NAD(P)H-binding protein [Dactylosporangium siamense]GIG45655.1 NmrA family transcriptional regulator [Dactylosporangium siamense]
MNEILVLGGTGKTGRRIVHRLHAAGIPVRVGSRTAPIPFDWTDRATWAPALSGIETVYVSYYPDLAVPGAPDDIGAFTTAAVDAGVSRLVLLSGRGEDEAATCERVVQGAGIDWTVLRCSWFNQNFSEDYLLDAVLAGEVALPVADVPEPFVDADDIADVAVAALTQDGHAGQVYELTGPRLLTFADAVAEIAAATGRPVTFVQVPPQDYAAALPPEVAELLMYLFTTVLDGRNAHLTGDLRRVLGREPRDFAEYAKATADVW